MKGYAVAKLSLVSDEEVMEAVVFGAQSYEVSRTRDGKEVHRSENWRTLN